MKAKRIEHKLMTLFLALVMSITCFTGSMSRESKDLNFEPLNWNKLYNNKSLCECILKSLDDYIILEGTDCLLTEIYAKFLSYLEQHMIIRFLKFRKKPDSLLHTSMKWREAIRHLHWQLSKNMPMCLMSKQVQFCFSPMKLMRKNYLLKNCC